MNNTELRNIPRDQIKPSPRNYRKRITNIEGLAASGLEKGILQPILVRPIDGAFQIVAGERRWLAAGMANINIIPAVIREMTDTEELEASVIENVQREDVHPLEEAEGFKELLQETGYTAEALGAKIDKSRAYIYARMKLLDLCPEAREAFYDGALDASTALLVARVPGKVLQKKAIKQLAKGYDGAPMSYRSAQEMMRTQFMLRLGDANFKLDDAELDAAAGSCEACPKRSGNDRDLYGDIADLNVCTDPACFENKRHQYNANIRANAEKLGVPIISGSAAKKIMPWNKRDIEGYVALDTICDEDAEGRTYRNILGDAAPVSAIIESASIHDKGNPMIEVAEPTALAAALQKAGFVPSVNEDDAEFLAQQAERQAKQDAKNKELETERAYRRRLFTAVRDATGQRFADQGLTLDDLRAIAVNIFRAFEDGDDIMEQHTGVNKFADDEEYQAEADKFESLIKTYDAYNLGVFLADACFIEEAKSDQADRLIAEAHRLGIDVEALKDPEKTAKKAIPATEAAQAKGKVAKKTAPEKTKAAPATPSNPKKSAAKAVAKTPKAKAKMAPAAPSMV